MTVLNQAKLNEDAGYREAEEVLSLKKESPLDAGFLFV